MLYPKLEHHLFDIAKAQAEPEGESHRVANDLDGKPVILIFLRGGQNVPAVTLLYGMEALHVNNAPGRPARMEDIVAGYEETRTPYKE